MTTKNCFFSLFFLFLVVSCAVVIFPHHASATVGGPTVLHGFTYNPTDESVYYIQNSFSGRGCPPILKKISLNSGNISDVYSCEQGEKDAYKNGVYDASLAMTEINKIINGFKPLSPISLKDNSLSIDVNFINSEKSSYTPPEIIRSNFSALVYQDSKKVTDFTLTGCTTKQPFLFEGYAIPGFEKKIVLLSSTKGDCIEGGYTNETIHVVGGLRTIQKEFYTTTAKGVSALVPHEGTLLVYEPETISPTSQNTSPQNTKDVSTPKNSPYITPTSTPPDEESNSIFPTTVILFSTLCIIIALVLIYKKK